MLDNIADLLLTVGLLTGIFGFPTIFVLAHMVPGTAVGVLVGDLIFFAMALRLAHKSGRNNITAMPLGLDTPSTLGMVFFVLGPAFLEARGERSLDDLAAANYAWQIGIWSIVLSGVFKFACALGSNWVRSVIPRAGLLGSLTAVALVLISFLPMLEVLHIPMVGFVSLAIILTTLVARIRFPARIPGALAALLVAGVIYYLLRWQGLLPHATEAVAFDPHSALWPTGWLEAFRFHWLATFRDAVNYLPIVIPFALATVVGGIDCVESAAAAGDEYDAGQVVGVEALATVVAGLCGGVIQTTPYIGHPAYKAMGGRAAYTLATALFVGGAGLIGYFGYLFAVIPQAAVLPILIFIGLEITAQSFHATTRRHYPAVALACVPAMAALVLIFLDKLFGDPAVISAGLKPTALLPSLQRELVTLRMLAGGFVVTSLLWASMLASIIDRRLLRAAGYAALAAAFSTVGIIHSPLPERPLAFPWDLPDAVASLPVQFGGGYLTMAALLATWGIWARAAGIAPIEDQEEMY